MLGVYDYTVVLTYVSLMVSIGGMMFAVNGHLHLGVMCLAISGLCDMFDGKIARTKKNRTEVEKRFGIQIDSLSDIVCFGVAPAVLCYCFGMRGVIGVAILMFYVLAGLIRLAWFNVMEEQRQEETTEKRECYQGLPITSMAIALDIIGMLLLNFVGGSMAGIVVSSVIRGIGNACGGATMWAMVSDTIDYGEWKTGYRTEGLVNSACSFGYKIGNGIGSALLGMILEVGGYVGDAAVQSASALRSIEVCFVWIQ